MCYDIFLNDFGDKTFCSFNPDQGQSELLNKKGIYFYLIGKKIEYIGSTKNSYEKRIKQYGTMTGGSCFLEGRHTDCRINSMLYHSNFIDKKDIKFYI